MPGYFVRMSIQWFLSMRHTKGNSVTVVSGDSYDRCTYHHGISSLHNGKSLRVEKLFNSRRYYGFILLMGRNTIVQSPNSSAALGDKSTVLFLMSTRTGQQQIHPFLFLLLISTSLSHIRRSCQSTFHKRQLTERVSTVEEVISPKEQWVPNLGIPTVAHRL